MQLLYLVITILILVKSTSCLGGTCRLSNDHKNYTCDGFNLSPFSVSRNTRPQILRLRVTNCKTTHIEEEALKFPSVQNVVLMCGIETFHENAFRNLNDLQELNLSQNAISELPNNLFQSSRKLQTLNLSKNNFEELMKDMFDGLNKLEVLILSYNAISKLNYKSFDKTPGLEKIYLNNNQIQAIPNAIFNQLRKLKLADLSYNNIQNINGLFVPTYSLTYLNASHNAIKDLTSRIFQTTRLEILDLSYNELTIIYEDSLKLDSLKELYLQENRISVFEVKGIGLKKFPLSLLDLRYNRLVYLEDDFLKTAQSLDILKVDGNPWDCKCFERMETLRGEIGVHLSPEFQLGELPLCVIGATDGCNVDKNDLITYYNLYQEQLEPR